MARTLIDRDTACGAEPEDLMRLDIPALDRSRPRQFPRAPRPRATWKSACRGREYWDVPVAEQTEHNVPSRVLEFLAKAAAETRSCESRSIHTSSIYANARMHVDILWFGS